MLSKSGFTLELISEILSLIPDIGLDKVVQRICENHIDYYLKKENRYYEHWMDLADKNADSNSSTLIRPKLKEHLKEHFSVINNFYLRKKIEESVEAGKI